MAARQILTHQWWNDERVKYQLVASQFVIDEASAGDPLFAADRLASLEDIALLPLDPEIAEIADEIMFIDNGHITLNTLSMIKETPPSLNALTGFNYPKCNETYQ